MSGPMVQYVHFAGRATYSLESSIHNDTPLPGLPKEENVYAQNRYDHVALKAGLSDLGDCRVPDCYQSERHIQYEAPP